MADTKITALTAITTVDPAADVLPIVDVSDTSMAASGTTKKITSNQILGAGGTATLASATITGGLTVGNGTSATQTFSGVTNILDIGFGSLRGGSAYGDVRLWTDRFRIYNNAGTQIIKNISGTNGDETWYDGAGGTRMTLNSTGLGVGGSPASKLTISDASAYPIRVVATAGTTAGIEFQDPTTGATRPNIASRGAALTIETGGSERLRIDSSGNVGIGVTPITSHNLSSAGPIGISGTNSGTRTSYISNSGACSIYYTDGGGSGFFADFGNLIIQPRTSAARSVVIATGSTTPVERAVVKSTGQVRFVPLASDPAGAEAGDVYYNSTSNKLKCYNGTTWNDLF